MPRFARESGGSPGRAQCPRLRRLRRREHGHRGSSGAWEPRAAGDGPGGSTSDAALRRSHLGIQLDHNIHIESNTERDRERERDIYIYINNIIFIYIYNMYIYI